MKADADTPFAPHNPDFVRLTRESFARQTFLAQVFAKSQEGSTLIATMLSTIIARPVTRPLVTTGGPR